MVFLLRRFFFLVFALFLSVTVSIPKGPRPPIFDNQSNPFGGGTLLHNETDGCTAGSDPELFGEGDE